MDAPAGIKRGFSRPACTRTPEPVATTTASGGALARCKRGVPQPACTEAPEIAVARDIAEGVPRSPLVSHSTSADRLKASNGEAFGGFPRAGAHTAERPIPRLQTTTRLRPSSAHAPNLNAAWLHFSCRRRACSRTAGVRRHLEKRFASKLAPTKSLRLTHSIPGQLREQSVDKCAEPKGHTACAKPIKN
mgnify:CR=1 FL=1